jgi:hypothetical protein
MYLKTNGFYTSEKIGGLNTLFFQSLVYKINTFKYKWQNKSLKYLVFNPFLDFYYIRLSVGIPGFMYYSHSIGFLLFTNQN